LISQIHNGYSRAKINAVVDTILRQLIDFMKEMKAVISEKVTQKRGWEGWLPGEFATYLARRNLTSGGALNVAREQHIFTNTRQALDIWCTPAVKKTAPSIGIKLKAASKISRA
jgi:hypothetical protein